MEPESEAPSRPSSITPEVAERLLSADLKNIVHKVSDGKTLSPSELQRVKAIAAGSNDSVRRSDTVRAKDALRSCEHSEQRRRAKTIPEFRKFLTFL